MAFPVVKDVTIQKFNSANTSHLVNMPATVNTGDLLLISFAAYKRYATITRIAPAGWTTIWNKSYSGVAGGSTYAKVADGTESGTAVDCATSPGTTVATHVFRISNWKGTLDGVESASITRSGSVANPPALTPTWGAADTLWLVLSQSSEASSSATPINYTTRILTTAEYDSRGASVIAATRELNAATEDPAQFSVGNYPVGTVGTVAIEPAAAAPTGYPNKVNGILGGSVNGVLTANILKVNGI